MNSKKGLRPKKNKSKIFKFKKSKDYTPDSLKQKEIRHVKHDRREKLNSLRLDELAVYEEYEDLVV